ncbi:MAG: hypothetical protein CMH98_11130 [Oceanospirillaceae bacterium]|nr:hypothetical protein [Oceanospirillaceae bacterium]
MADGSRGQKIPRFQGYTSQKARSGEIAGPARGARPLYEDKGPEVSRKSLNKNLWDTSARNAAFQYSSIVEF